MPAKKSMSSPGTARKRQKHPKEPSLQAMVFGRLPCDPPDNRMFSPQEWAALLEHLSLSPRQAQVLRHLLNGEGDKWIARELGIALPTIRSHLGQLEKKLHVQGRQMIIIEVFLQFRSLRRREAV